MHARDAVITQFWEPLYSFPNLWRDADILIGGMYEDEGQVSGMGYLTATFVHDLFGIPATGKKDHIHFGKFFVMHDGKVTESHCILHELSLMQQARFQVLPPALARESSDVQKPRADDGTAFLHARFVHSPQCHTIRLCPCFIDRV